MKAAVYYETGAPEVLRYEDVPDPVCDRDGVVMRVEVISVEGGDTLHRHWGALPSKPHIVGYQAAGEVIEVGDEVVGIKIGDKVVAGGRNGSHAELRAVPARSTWLIPEGMDIRQAAVIPVAFGTSQYCLFELGRIQKGDVVLVQAGASGVGVAAIQLAARAGAVVLATASSDARLEALKPLGLTHGINYLRDDVVQEVAKLTDGRMANIAIDGIGGPVMQASIKSLAPHGQVFFLGEAGRERTKVEVSSMLPGNHTLSGIFLGGPIIASDRWRNLMQQFFREVADGELKAVIDKTFALKDAAEAHRYIESRQAVGRVLLVP